MNKIIISLIQRKNVSKQFKLRKFFEPWIKRNTRRQVMQPTIMKQNVFAPIYIRRTLKSLHLTPTHSIVSLSLLLGPFKASISKDARCIFLHSIIFSFSFAKCFKLREQGLQFAKKDEIILHLLYMCVFLPECRLFFFLQRIPSTVE